MVPLRARTTCSHAELLGKLGMGFEMPPLAMHRDGRVGLDPSVKLLEFAAARMARTRGPRASWSVMTSTSMSASAFCTRPTAFSLPGMVREEKITQSPCVELDVRVLALRDARHGGPGLALAAGAQRHAPCGGGSLENIVSSWNERSGSR